MPVQTDPRAALAGELFDLATARIGAVEASRFMFSGNIALGGQSPLQLLRAGRDDDVKRAVLQLIPGSRR